MKTLRSIICSSFSLLLAFGFNACKEVVSVNHQQAVISIVPQSLHLSYDKFHFPSSEEESLSLLVYSTNVEWEITDIPDWITVSPKTGGDGTTNVTITVALNTHPTDRVGVLSIKALDDSWSYAQTITVSQARGYYYAYPEKDRVEFDGSASSAVVKVSSNIDDWTIEKDASFNWCTATKTEGSINITVTPNTNSWSRQGYIQISTLDSEEYITVVQRPANISTTTERLDFTVTGGTQSVQISSEAPWAATTSYSWINVTPESGTEGDATITVQATANNSLTTRNGYVYIVLSDTRKIEIPVSQECISFSIDKTQIDAPVTGQEYQLQLKSNVQWKLLDSIPTWMTLSTKSGTGNSQIDIKVNANPSASDRSAKFKIAPVSLTNAATEITVKQNGHTFDADSTALHFSDKAGSAYFNIKSDGSWIATPSAEWITLDKESGTGDSKIKVTVTENTADSARVGYVNASIEGKQEKVTVYQQGKYLNISSNALEFTSKGGSTQVSIKTNNSWTAKSSDEWIQISKTEGEEDCDITITTTDNASANSRNGYVEVTPKESNPIRINISQNARYLTVSVDTLYFFSKGGTSDPIIINTDGSAEVTTEAEWLTVNKSSTTQFTLTATNNDGETIRSGSVLIRLDDLKEGTMTANVVVRQFSDLHNGHEFVDLGLSVKWATCNVGAIAPENVGNYYAWGEIEPKTDYTWNTYQFGTEKALTKYCLSTEYGKDGVVDGITSIETFDDVARIEWGGLWRMPTRSDFEELIANCTFTSTTKNGVSGYEIRSKVAGYEDQTIFLPNTGYKMSTYTYDEGRIWYWTSTIDEQYSSGAWVCLYDRPYKDFFSTRRYYGIPVRPVCSRETKLDNITIELNNATLPIEIGDIYALAATVKNDDTILDCGVFWTTGDSSIATVSKTGVVTGKSIGSTTITATCLGKAATCMVAVTEKTYNYVDLGLSVMWATHNVGTDTPEGYGDYYAWGELEPKTDYSWVNYIFRSEGDSNDNVKFSRYNTNSSYGTIDNKTTLDIENDVAHVLWGGEWRMPTYEEQKELVDNCTWTWTTVNGVKGYRVTSNKTGYSDKSIFLPAAGCWNFTSLNEVGNYSHYWSSSLCIDETYCAWEIDFNSDHATTRSDNRLRRSGHSVRPVCPSETWLSTVSLSLNNISKTIVISDTCTLRAIVKHGNDIIDRKVVWSTGDSTVAIVNETGFITAIGVGTTTITATCLNKTATCTITVANPVYEYVDLGLSANWATFNVGAIKPEGYGDYYAWGETEIKSTYSWKNYKWYKSEKYASSNITVDIEDDVAHVKWGGSWRMPTKAEQDELCDDCTWTLTTVNGVKGYRVTSNISGYTDRSIFLPAAGFRKDEDLYFVGSKGYYWSGSLSAGHLNDPWYIRFDTIDVARERYGFYYGQPVRPVIPSEAWLSNVSIALSSESESILLGDTCTLRATVKHGSDILNRDISWSTGDSTIATVNETGFVTGKGAGTTVITATCLGKTATCTITVTLPEPEYVDLGLSVKWATCNIGASSPEEYGNYYAWGETETKSSYTWTNYKWCNNGSFKNLTKYNTDSYYGDVDNITILAPEDDIAHITLGGNWRMPTTDEMNELIQYCTWHWTTLNGVYGCVFTSKKVGYMNCSIFLPAGGYYQDSKLNEGSYGNYWTSSLGGTKPGNGSYLYFSSSNAGMGSADRSLGYRIRPVYDASEANNN